MENNIEQQILFKLGTMEAKIDGINKRLDLMNGSVSAHDKRINNVESDCDKLSGKAMGAGAGVGAVVGAVAILISYIK